MKLIHPRSMTEKEAEAYRLCVAQSRFSLEREEVLAAILRQVVQIEAGVAVVDAGLPVPGLGKIDLLADDGKGRIVVVGYVPELDARECSAMLQRSEWVADNRELLEHIYGRPLAPEGVRTWIFAGAVRQEAAVLLRRMAGPMLSSFQCEGVELGTERWLVVQALSFDERLPAAAEAMAQEAEKRPVQLHSVLSHDEINDFFGVAEEEITNSGAYSQE